MYTGKYYFETSNFKLIYADVIKAIKKINDKSIDMIFADPPYFLSNDGITCRARVLFPASHASLHDYKTVAPPARL